MGGAIEGFYSTWDSTRKTFGQGTPQTGEQFDDSSAALRGLDSQMAAAAPGNRWSGTAATAYDAANTEHRNVINQIADLDKKMATEVTNAAQVVTAGRRDLEAVRQRVAAAEANVPPGKAGEQLKMKIAQNGLAQIQDIIHKTNAESNAIGGRIQGLNGDYQKLGIQKFAPKEGEGPLDVDGDADEKDDAEKKAKDDVEKTLEDGDKEAAARVEKVLGTITPYHELTDEQSAYLNEMQSQQHDLSVKDLKSAEDRLGDKGHVIGDSWQLMSNDDVPRSAGAFDDQQKGGFDRLPQSVQDAIKSPGLESAKEIHDVSSIVKDGNAGLQTGTEIDRELLRKADRMMDAPGWDGDFTPTDDPTTMHDPRFDPVVRDIFDSAGRDHQVVLDQITGNHGDDGQDFMHDINQHAWGDGGKSAGALFSWTENPTGSDTQIAAQAAETYGTYLGAHQHDLMNLPGNHTLGEFNPELTRAYAHGLGNYVPDITDLSTANQTDAFGNPDLGDPDKKIAKGIFSVLSTDKDASDWFNGKATAAALAAQSDYAQAAKDHVPNLEAYNDKLLDAATLQAMVDVGTVNAAHASGLNAHDQAVQAYERQSSAYDFGVDAASKITGFIPEVGPAVSEGIGQIAPALKDSFIGPPPGEAAGAPIVSNIGEGGAAQIALNPLIAAGVPITGLPSEYLVPVSAEHPDMGMRVGTVDEIERFNHKTISENTWQTTLKNVTTYTVGPVANPVESIAQRYEDLVKKPEP